MTNPGPITAASRLVPLDAPAPEPIVAVRPARGRIIHLHQADYQPGEKTRPNPGDVAMCGAAIWPNGIPKREFVKTPLAEALEWTSLEPNPRDPRPTWTWCRPCIGHAVVSRGLARASLLAVTQSTRPKVDGWWDLRDGHGQPLEHAVQISEDTDSVRGPGWYVAECDGCDWTTSGTEPVVEAAADEHRAGSTLHAGGDR